MPAPQRRFAQAVPDSGVIADGVETVVATTPPVSSSFPGCCYLIEFNIGYALGDNATGLVFVLRRTGLQGDSTISWQINPLDTAGLSGAIACSAVDQFGTDAASIVWVLTANPAGDTVEINEGGTASVTIDVGGRPSAFSD